MCRISKAWYHMYIMRKAGNQTYNNDRHIGKMAIIPLIITLKRWNVHTDFAWQDHEWIDPRLPQISLSKLLGCILVGHSHIMQIKTFI